MLREDARIRATDVMTKNVVTTHEKCPRARIRPLAGRTPGSGLPVVEADGHVIGLGTDADLIARQSVSPTRHPWWHSLFLQPGAAGRGTLEIGGLHRDQRKSWPASSRRRAGCHHLSELLSNPKRLPLAEGAGYAYPSDEQQDCRERITDFCVKLRQWTMLCVCRVK